MEILHFARATFTQEEISDLLNGGGAREMEILE